MKEKPEKTLTFFTKEKITCPVCEAGFSKEELRSGGGRLIAGDLTIELRRLYEPSKTFGAVYPLIYPVTVCPACYYAAFPKDFLDPPSDAIPRLSGDADRRASSIRSIFEELDFEEPRTLKEGAAGYYFAIMSYDFFPADYGPTMKKGLSALRAAWLFSDLHRSFPGDNYDYIAKLFYRKARFFYTLAVDYEQTGQETVAQVGFLGPDVDNNYGYDGVLYLAAYLEYSFGPKDNLENRKASLTSAKRTVARIVGMGRASKSKPSILLDNARDLHTTIGEELEKLEPEEIGEDEEF